jgi:hypothetical protein
VFLDREPSRLTVRAEVIGRFTHLDHGTIEVDRMQHLKKVILKTFIHRIADLEIPPEIAAPSRARS